MNQTATSVRVAPSENPQSCVPVTALASDRSRVLRIGFKNVHTDLKSVYAVLVDLESVGSESKDSDSLVFCHRNARGKIKLGDPEVL